MGIVPERGKEVSFVQGRQEKQSRGTGDDRERGDILGAGNLGEDGVGFLAIARDWEDGTRRTWLSRKGWTSDWAAPAARHASRSYEPTGSNE